ncbi:hypothetical protein [Cytobacillus horneckiae]|uniref:hypothetical protein n=1 Tax=Cytobacillus horneckiae TaxID=549687 RepID=UPI003D9A3946
MKFTDVTKENPFHVQAMKDTGIPYQEIKIYEYKDIRVVYTIINGEVRVSMSKPSEITIREMNKVTNKFLGVHISEVNIYLSPRGVHYFELKENDVVLN